MTRKRTHYILFYITLLLAIVSVFAIPYIKVNSDLTKYLPDDSQTSQGLAILTDEFGEIPNMKGDVEAMFKDLSNEEREAFADSLRAISEVETVRMQVSQDSVYTLYDMNVPKSVDQKKLGQTIAQRLGHDAVVETSQDGATPPLSVIVIAAVLILIILLVMAQSWVESFIILANAGMAILLNMGTNALLPSVSITTNYIGSILQMVLSLDYSIVLINRYRQEQRDETDKRDAVLAANKAIRRAFPSIMSSAATTILGLLMLCFMRLKIGMDMGIVLAKGVICSLICTFTALPSMMMLLRQSINHSVKKTPVIPTDRLGRFATSHKIPMAIFAVVLFGVSFYLSGKTNIFFCTNGESRIEEVFPQSNPVVVIYDREDDNHVPFVAEKLQDIDGVKRIVSYSTLLQKPYSSAGMVDYIQGMLNDFRELMPDTVPTEMLTPQLMKTLYYMESGQDQKLKMSFPEMVRFIEEECLNDSLTARFIDKEMRQQLSLLHSIQNQENITPIEEQEPIERIVTSAKPKKKYKTAKEVSRPQPKTDTVSGEVSLPEYISLCDFLPKLHEAAPSATTAEMSKLSNRQMLNRQMSKQELSEFIGSSMAQTKMVFKFAKGKHQTMTPIEYVHVLTDDLFRRKLLRAMVSDEQVEALTIRAQLMDLCNEDAALSAQEMKSLLNDFGISMNHESIYAVAFPQDLAENKKESETIEIESGESPILEADSTAQRPNNAIIQQPTKQPHKTAIKVKVGKRSRSAANRQEKIMNRVLALLEGKEQFNAQEMAGQFRYLGKAVPEEQVELLYIYYGIRHDSTYHEQQMTPEELINYLCDTLVNDPRLALFSTAGQRDSIRQIKPLIQDQIGRLRSEKHGLLVLMTDLPHESERTYQSLDSICEIADKGLAKPHYMIGESPMYREMKTGFGKEISLISWLTIIAIFLIVAISFKSIIVPLILVITVMTAVFVNVIFAGLMRGEMLYLAYLIVQAILMGATIDYGILFANYYKEKRRTMEPYDAVKEAYKGSIRTITTSGLIMIVAPGVMAILVDDITISAIVGSLSIGAAMAVLMILIVLPGVLVAFDKLVVHQKKS
ncbi:MAG: MMPL family transporter [Paludibacteraceae bacterium]|nr:MMPL family transporter [Paludibacteraceae bacterium]